MAGQRKTARQRENSQLAGRFRKWWQVLGSNRRPSGDLYWAGVRACLRASVQTSL
jgi:hypothetical protein